jgi:hypothetical protein
MCRSEAGILSNRCSKDGKIAFPLEKLKIAFPLEKLIVIHGAAESTRFDLHAIARLFSENMLTRTSPFFAMRVTR